MYRYWGDQEPLQTIIARMYRLEQGGTFAVFLGCDALRKGYGAAIYTYNVTVFDPTWFTRNVDIAERLTKQREVKSDERLQVATSGYLQFLQLGGRLRFADLSQVLVRALLRFRLLQRSAALHLSVRVLNPDGSSSSPGISDMGQSGHGTQDYAMAGSFSRARRHVLVVDPYQPNPYGEAHEYWISIDRVVTAILLGIVTHDANLLVVYPRRKRPP